MTAPNTPTREMAAQLADILRRLDDIERGRSTQLGNSTLDGTSLQVVSPDGTRLASWGYQPDGSASTRNTDPKPLSRPNTPIVTSALAGLNIEWNGKLIQETPGNFSHVSIHVSPVEGFVASEGNQVGAMREAGVFAAAPLDYVTHYVKLIAWSTSGVASEPSFEQHGSPGKVVADEVLNGIIGELALAEGAVKEAALAAGAVTSTKIDDDAVTTPKLVAGAVQGDKIAARTIQGEHVIADAISTEHLKALSITADELGVNSVTAGKIVAGAIDATKLAATLVLGNRIIAGDPTGVRVELSASGILVVRDDGDTTFSVDSSTGDVTSMGEYYTSRFGERLAMNSGGLQSPTIRAYPARGSRYADLRSFTRTVRGVDLANWEFRLPLAPGVAPYEAGLVDFVVYDANFNPVNTSRLRYRPFDNGSGNVHPGWAADGQDAAVVFWNNRVWITNSANTARAGLTAGHLLSQGDIVGYGSFFADGNAYKCGPYDGAIRWGTDGALDVVNRAGTEFRGIRSTNFATVAPSWRRLKTDRRTITESLGRPAGEVIDELEVGSYRYDLDADGLPDDLTDGAERFGVMLDEVPEKLRTRHPDAEDEMTTSWDRDGMLALALSAIQDQRREIEALRGRVAELEAAP